jgi:peptide deformylase
VSSRAFDDPVLEERRRSALLQIRQYGDPVLRARAAEVADFDDALRREAEAMAALMRDAHGVGLAAPQVGRSRRLIVFREGEDAPALAICNPRIVWESEEREVLGEGCLSIGEVVVDVERPVAVRISAQDLAGESVELAPEGFAARVIQHEIDHLDGILILDRTDPEQRKEALRALRGA